MVKDSRSCPNCSATVPEGHHYCGNCGTRYGGGGDGTDPSKQTLLFGPVMAPGRAKLILIKGTGDSIPGLSFHLNATNHHAGRRQGAILFTDDPYLSPRHSNFFYRDNQLHLRDESSCNGSFVRVRQPTTLTDGDRFMVGNQVLRFERLDLGEEYPMKDGTLMYVSPVKDYRFRLVQVIAGGTPGTAYSSPNNEIIVGREGCDMNFPDDRNVSRQHAKISWDDASGGATLYDLSSRNGTYLARTGDVALMHGDYVFIGQHLLRVEITT